MWGSDQRKYARPGLNAGSRVVHIPTGRYYRHVPQIRDLAAVVFDYGGVLTTPLSSTTGSWLQADGIDPDGFAALMRSWLGRDAEPGNPIHLLETGELDVPEFERRFAARLVAADGQPVEAEGVLTRLFAAMKPSDEMLD